MTKSGMVLEPSKFDALEKARAEHPELEDQKRENEKYRLRAKSLERPPHNRDRSLRRTRSR